MEEICEISIMRGSGIVTSNERVRANCSSNELNNLYAIFSAFVGNEFHIEKLN